MGPPDAQNTKRHFPNFRCGAKNLAAANPYRMSIWPEFVKEKAAKPAG